MKIKVPDDLSVCDAKVKKERGFGELMFRMIPVYVMGKCRKRAVLEMMKIKVPDDTSVCV